MTTLSDDETELRATNPKGRLFEFCARARCGRPKLAIERKGNTHGVAMSIALHGRRLESGMQWAPSRLLAEQRAAKVLLSTLAENEEEGEPGEWVSAEDAACMQRENPKGALLERCTLHRLAPVIDVRPIVVGGAPCFEASAMVILSDRREVWGELRRGDDARAVEQAAAASLRARLDAELTDAPMPAAATTRDPRSALNELQQRGRLLAYGFTLVRIDGPPHAPVFRVRGHVERKGGDCLETEEIGAPSKREAERRAAERLVEALTRASYSYARP